MDRNTLAEKVAIVTGSSRGIGRATAIAFSAEGCSVVINYRSSREEAEDVAREVRERGGACMVHQADVSREEDVDRMVTAAVARFGRLDVLVNNAGIAGPKAFLEIDPEDWRRMMDNDLTSVYLCSRAVTPHMLRAGWGRIINIASTSGLSGGTSGAHYAAAKGGVIAFTKSLGRELAPRGITVNAIVPSKIDTGMLDSTFASDADRTALQKRIPVGRFGRPQEIAGLAVFLATEPAAYITGETIVASGGY